MATWQLQTAKARLSELLRKVREEGPQTITVRGKEEYVVMRKEDAHTPAHGRLLAGAPKTIWDLFEPIRGLGDDLEEGLHEVREDAERFAHKD